MGSSRITTDQVRHVAKLARLAPDEAEINDLTTALDAILGYVAQLDEIDTSDVEPTLYAAGRGVALREDEVRPSLPAEVALAAAPRARAGGFSVPRVLEEES